MSLTYCTYSNAIVVIQGCTKDRNKTFIFSTSKMFYSERINKLEITPCNRYDYKIQAMENITWINSKLEKQNSTLNRKDGICGMGRYI